MTSIGFLWVLNQIDFSPKKKCFIINIKTFLKKIEIENKYQICVKILSMKMKKEKEKEIENVIDKKGFINEK